jgi:hypothetical protein
MLRFVCEEHAAASPKLADEEARIQYLLFAARQAREPPLLFFLRRAEVIRGRR